MNTLELDEVEKLLRCFDIGLSIRAAAEQVGCAKGTAERYSRMWRQALARTLKPAREESGPVIVCRVGPTAGRALAREAAARGVGRAELASRMLEAVAEAELTRTLLEG